jgi:hypothetical protein
MHRPLQEMMNAYNAQEVYGIKEQAINCQALNTGLFGQVVSSNKTAWISSGGDPDNDYMAIYHGVHMSIARKSGYSTNQDIIPGARVFHLTHD